MGGTFDRKPPADKAWCRMTSNCRIIVAAWPSPHYLPQALRPSTMRRPAWLPGWALCPNLIPRNGHKNQNLADSNTWTSSSLTSLKTVHSQLLADDGCIEWAPPAADEANDAAAAQQRVADYANARPLPIPPLNLLASMQARQDEDEGNAAARASLPPQRHITTRIMHQWPQHLHTAANPPSSPRCGCSPYGQGRSGRCHRAPRLHR